MQKKSISWAWVIFWIIVCWPLGLFLFIKKIADEKSALMSAKTTVISVIACTFIVIGILGIIGNYWSEQFNTSSSILTILFIVGGALLFRKTRQINNTATKYKKYIDLVINQNYRSIDAIASAMGLSCDAVIKDLQTMIDRGYLKNAFIHLGNRTIEFKMPAPAPSQIFFTQAAASPASAAPQKVPVRCSSCGAKNVATAGQVTECEYCGNPIKA
jgi:hypothetical protein